MTTVTDRYRFISDALHGEGGFRPVVQTVNGVAQLRSASYLVPYPRESESKFARRNEVAWYDSPLKEAVMRFGGYLAEKMVKRDLPQELYQVMAEDIDGCGNSIDVFWSDFTLEAKARGAMLLLVDMPASMPTSLGTQIAQRVAPYWMPVKPEQLTDYELAEDGRFKFAEFSGRYTKESGDIVDCTWHFDRAGWWAEDGSKEILDAGDHSLGECPLLIFTEHGKFPCFGGFAPIADMGKRLFNLHSELDELLRSQTFSLLTMQVPDNTDSKTKLEAARVAGETIGTNNLLVHTGTTPEFVAPPDGPASTYMERIAKMEERIAAVALDVRGSDAQESGVALQMRFRSLNAALAGYAMRLEDLERRAWDLTRRWLGLSVAPEIEFPRDFTLADVATEMTILEQMNGTAMPQEVIAKQQKRVVALQYPGLPPEEFDRISDAIDTKTKELT